MSTSPLIEFTTQWVNPTEVTTVLMVIGGDVVQKALAQCTGTLYAPVCFSFGWVSFAFIALLNVLGDGRLLPPPDYPVKIFNLDSGYGRDNKNWVVGRILRDHERTMWRLHGLHSNGIRITVFEAVDPEQDDREEKRRKTNKQNWFFWGNQHHNGRAFTYGWIHVYGLVVTLLQLIIAAIPIIVDRDWGIMVITGGGTILSLVFGAIPQWTVEKLPGRGRSRHVYALTSGNGSKDVMVIKGMGKCWNLEDFATLDSPRNGHAWDTFKRLRAADHPGETTGEKSSTFRLWGRGTDTSTEPELGGGGDGGLNRASTAAAPSRRRSSFVTESRDFCGVPMGFAVTMAVCVTQCFLWLILLITVAALNSNTWYLVAVGGLGMFQNAILAAMTRPAARRGLHLRRIDKIVTRKVMDGLMDLESEYGVGQPLVSEFFSGKLKPAEVAWWNGDHEEYDQVRMRDPLRGIPRSHIKKKAALELLQPEELSVVPNVTSEEAGAAAGAADAAGAGGGVESEIVSVAGPPPGAPHSSLVETAGQMGTADPNPSQPRSVVFAPHR